MAIKNEEELLDALHEHIFGDDEPTEEDEDWFEEMSEPLTSFIKKLSGDGGNGGSSRRRRQSSQQSSGGRRQASSSSPRRKRRTSSGGNDSNYGSSLLFGN